jgi:hypothetical protein
VRMSGACQGRPPRIYCLGSCALCSAASRRL